MSERHVSLQKQHFDTFSDESSVRVTPYRWVLLSEHCRRTGETSQMVHTRRKRGIWMDGIHTLLASKRRLYVNVEEFNKWVEKQGRENFQRA